MLNEKLFNLHDILVIGLITWIVHMIAAPLFSTIDQNVGSNQAQ